jgi:hypothetical protein
MMGNQRDSVDLLETLSSWKKTQSYYRHPYRYGRTYRHQEDADWRIGSCHTRLRDAVEESDTCLKWMFDEKIGYGYG